MRNGECRFPVARYWLFVETDCLKSSGQNEQRGTRTYWKSIHSGWGTDKASRTAIYASTSTKNFSAHPLLFARKGQSINPSDERRLTPKRSINFISFSGDGVFGAGWDQNSTSPPTSSAFAPTRLAIRRRCQREYPKDRTERAIIAPDQGRVKKSVQSESVITARM